MSLELKIKAKSLSAESQMIRKEELKLKRQARWHREQQDATKAASIMRLHDALYRHRLDVVRTETRATQLARAYIAGRTYKSVEPNTRQPIPGYVLGRLEKLIKKYGQGASRDDIAQWIEA